MPDCMAVGYGMVICRTDDPDAGCAKEYLVGVMICYEDRTDGDSTTMLTI